jgi:hypothetical protein
LYLARADTPGADEVLVASLCRHILTYVHMSHRI